MIQTSESSISSISPEILKKIKLAFNTFDTNCTGKINPKQIRIAMENLGEAEKNPTLYQLFLLLEKSEDMKEEITFDEFIKAIYEKLGDNKSQSGIQRLFEMFKNGSESNNLTLNDLKKMSVQLNENISDEELQDMMNRISEGKGQLSFEQFYKIIKE